MESQTPTSRKGVQQLIARLATLGRFISHFIDRLKPFFTTLKGAKQVGWNMECDQDFMEIKQYLTYDAPKPGGLVDNPSTRRNM